MLTLTLEFIEDMFVGNVARWLEFVGDVTDFATGHDVPETLD